MSDSNITFGKCFARFTNNATAKYFLVTVQIPSQFRVLSNCTLRTSWCTCTHKRKMSILKRFFLSCTYVHSTQQQIGKYKTAVYTIAGIYSYSVAAAGHLTL